MNPPGYADTVRPENYCIECKGIGIFGGPGSYYDVPGRGKPCPACNGTGVECASTATTEELMTKYPILSGWCESANHHKCRHHLQEQRQVLRRNGVIVNIPDVWCCCKCHK